MAQGGLYIDLCSAMPARFIPKFAARAVVHSAISRFLSPNLL